MDDDQTIDQPSLLPEVTGSESPAVTLEDFREGFGEELRRTLDLSTWSVGEDLSKDYDRLDNEVREAVQRESDVLRRIRKEIFPRLAGYPGAPKESGVYETNTEQIERTHRGLLFNGGVEACDGTQQVHDTLPLTIFQIGVGLVSYQGNQGTWFQRLFRRDLRVRSSDPTEEMLKILERRDQRGGLNQTNRRDVLSELARRGIMAYAERAILLQKSNATWRLGHGNPAPYELITGSGNLDLMIESTKVIRQLVEGHQKFVFVASEPSDRVLLTIGQALRPLEYAVVKTLKEMIDKTVEHGHYRMRVRSADTTWDGAVLKPDEWIAKFRDVVGPQVVVGVYRATGAAPAQVFYAHKDHVHLAAHIALADSMLQEHRGFPLLLDLADHVCSAVFGSETLMAPVGSAYTDAGAPWRFLTERATRPR